MSSTLKRIAGVFHHHSDIFFPKYSHYFLLFLILIMAAAYRYPKIAELRPQGVHQWRQCDCLSITRTLYNGDADFLHTKVYNLLRDNEGRTISEFPLVYYVVSRLWRVFGEHEWIFRAFNFLISILSMLALLKVFEYFLKDTFWSIFSVSLLYTSAIYAYYSFNFLMNTTAFNMALIGWYFFFSYYRKGKLWYLYATFVFFLLGGLLKMSSLISFVALCGLFLFEKLKLFPLSGNERPIFTKNLAFILPALLISGCTILWIFYVKHYNQMWNSGVFLVGILPIWDMTQEAIHQTIDNVRRMWINGYFYKPTHLFFFAGLLLSWIFFSRSNKILVLITTLISVGFVAFIILFFEALQAHDYYVIDLLILAVFILLTLFTSLQAPGKRKRILNLTRLRVLAVIFLVLNILNTRDEIARRYRWNRANHSDSTAPYMDIEPFLEANGIGDTCKIIAASDPSINISLYLSNRKGWTRYGTFGIDNLDVSKWLGMGADYLLIGQDQFMNEQDLWNGFDLTEIGIYKGISVYKISAFTQP
jgi:hypothetical protein